MHQNYNIATTFKNGAARTSKNIFILFIPKKNSNA